jgi:ribosomal protein S18 acetylase RimI-like enzyme
MLARCQRGGIHRRAPTLAGWGARARMMSSWSLDGIEYRRLAADHDPEALFAFNKEHGSTPLNFIPDEPVRAHFGRLATGETTVWGAFAGEELAGFISGEVGGGYWRQTGPGQEATSDNDGATCFINEFVVNPKFRGKRIGVRLTSASVDPELGIWAANPAIKEMYTTVHVDNIASRTAFVKGGYEETVTYTDQHRDRNTTVLRRAAPGLAILEAPRGNTRPMRVVGVQSGNAVDGIDVGIFDFAPLRRSSEDPRQLERGLEYSVVANKTFPFTAERRNTVG